MTPVITSSSSLFPEHLCNTDSPACMCSSSAIAAMAHPLDQSNSLSREQVNEFLMRAKAVQSVKFLDPRVDRPLEQMIACLLEIGRLEGDSRIYFTPEERKNFKSNMEEFEDLEKDVESQSKPKTEIKDLLEEADRIRITWTAEFLCNMDNHASHMRLALVTQLTRTLEEIIIELHDDPAMSLVYIGKGRIDLIEKFKRACMTEEQRAAVVIDQDGLERKRAKRSEASFNLRSLIKK